MTSLPLEGPAAADAPAPDGSFVLTGGWVVDGTSAPPFRADVAVENGRITDVGRLGPVADGLGVDCTGLYLMPGFVDAHVHGETAVFDPDVQLAMLAQGVTTVILGQDGISSVPGGRATQDYVEQYFGAINGDLHLPRADFVSVADALASYDRQVPVNVGYLVPRGNVRHEAMGTENRPATEDERQAMDRLIADGMEQGALGLSTGLEYIPDLYGDQDEITRQAAVAHHHGGVYVTHMRGYEAAADIGILEAQGIGRDSGVPVHISHFHGPVNMLQTLLDEARQVGVEVTYDSYPYTRGFTIVTMVGLPKWVQEGGLQQTLVRLADPEQRPAIRDWAAANAGAFSRICLSQVEAEAYQWAEGMWLEDAAAQAGQPVVDFLCDMLLAAQLRVSSVFNQPRTNTIKDIVAHFQDQAHMAGSDSIYLGGSPHPRGWGTFARFLGVHTRELGDWTWGQASQHLSSHACRRFGLLDRGLIRPGMAADLVALDPRTVGDRSTYETPRIPAQGVYRVWIEGHEVFRNGALTGRSAGRALRRGESTLAGSATAR